MPGPVMTVREIYTSTKEVWRGKTKTSIFRYPHLRQYITKRGRYYYIKQMAGGERDKPGYPITDKHGKSIRKKIEGSTRVWHRGKGFFSVYHGRQDRKIIKPPQSLKKGYFHTGDKKYYGKKKNVGQKSHGKKK